MIKYFVPLIFLFVIGCSHHSQETSTSSFTNFPGGRELYRSKCSGCHKLYERTGYTAEQWDIILVDMKKKAKITAEEKNSILNYLSEKPVAGL